MQDAEDVFGRSSGSLEFALHLLLHLAPSACPLACHGLGAPVTMAAEHYSFMHCVDFLFFLLFVGVHFTLPAAYYLPVLFLCLD